MRKLFILLLFIPVTLLAQNTRIKGSVTNGQGQVVRLLAFDDFISKKIITLGEGMISGDGSFEFESALDDTIRAFLDINYQRAEIFLEPGKTYNLEITYDPANQLESYFNRQGLVYDFMEEDPEELNHMIWRFNELYNTFVMENFEHIVKLKDKERVSTFEKQVSEEFDGIEHDYLNNYIHYKMADVFQFARLKGRSILAGEYFVGKPVLYENVEYTFFFEEFFEKYLTTNPDVITISDLIIAVNEDQDIQAILDALYAVPWLHESSFRELVLIHGLKGLYYNGTYKKTAVLAMLKDIYTETSDPMHRKITSNLLETLSHLAPGTPAPDIELISIAGQPFKLKSIRGKPILLTFFRSGQKGTENAFLRLAELYDYYRSGLEIISVSMDADPKAYLPLANSGGYRWTFAHYGNNPEVYDLYDIRNLPLYVLIDTDGNIVMYPAPSPEQDLENAIMKVVH